jgi:hypothetical protein
MPGWDGYEKLVLDKLNRLDEGLLRVEDKVEALTIDVAMLKVKAGVWGATAGLIPASVGFIMVMFH